MGNEIKKKNVKNSPKVPTANEVKTYIMVAKSKLTLYRNKKVVSIKQKRAEIVKCLKENNLDVAKAKMDSLIRDEDIITCYDILGPICEILKEKVTYIMMSNECPPDVRAPLDTVIYASSRLEVDELHKLRELILLKYGNMYVSKADSNADRLVNINLIEKLKIKPAVDAFITIRLKQLCKQDKIPFEFPEEIQPSDFGPPQVEGQFAGQGYNPYSNNNNPYQGGGGFNPYNNNNNNQGFGNSNQGGNDFGNFNQVMNNQGNNNGGFGNFKQSMSGNNNFGGNQYGQQSQMNFQQNPYGQQSQMNFQQNPYGQQSQMNFQQNPYGQQSQISSQQNPYGQQSQISSQQNPYGQQSQISSQQNPYGQQSQISSQQNPYGQQSQISTQQNPYGQESQMNFKQNNNPQSSQFGNPYAFNNSNINNNENVKKSNINNNDFPNPSSNNNKQSQFNQSVNNDDLFPKPPSNNNPSTFGEFPNPSIMNSLIQV